MIIWMKSERAIASNMIRKISTKSIAAREAAKLALPLMGFAFGANEKVLRIYGGARKVLARDRKNPNRGYFESFVRDIKNIARDCQKNL